MANASIGSKIDTKLIQQVIDRLKQHKRVRRRLEPWGRINIDRQLPFLCLYRKSEIHNPGDEKVVLGEASYCTVSSDASEHTKVCKLVSTLAKEMSSKFDAFLLIEVWIRPFEITDDMAAAPPNIKVIKPDLQYPQTNIDGFVKSLKTIRIQKQPAKVEIETGQPCPLKLEPILSRAVCKKNNIFLIGLEIADVFRDSVTEQFFPRVRQRILRGVSSSMQKLVFDFTKDHTNYQPSNFQALGKKSLVKAAWELDRQLASINESFDLVLSVTPTNTASAFEEFKKNQYDKVPRFYYRPLSIDPSELKRKLYSLKIDRVEDPAMAQLFLEHQRSLDSRITLLADRDSDRFIYESIQLYGKPTERNVEVSRHLLNSMSTKGSKSPGILVDSSFLVKAALKELKYYYGIDNSFTPQIEIRDDIAGVLVSNGNLLISKSVSVAENRVDSVLHHEIGTHLLTFHNGQVQPFKQLKAGFVGYDELQEGLAVLAEYLCGGLTRSRLKTLAARVVAVQAMIDGASFVEAFRELVNRFGFPKKGAFKLLMRVYRGGGFTKDAVYLRGLLWLLDYFRHGGDLETLMVGKFPTDHLGIIRELMWRGVVKKPILMPRYLHVYSTKERLEKLNNGLDINQIAEEIGN